MSDKIQILIVEDDVDFSFLIKSMILKEPQMEVAGCAFNRQEAVTMACLLQPDIVLMDLNLSSTHLDGIGTSREIRLLTNAKIIILTAFENPQITIEACKNAYACAYVFKSQFSILADTIRKAAHGVSPQEQMINALILSDLSDAEHSVFKMMLGGDIKLKSTPKTIYNQKSALLKKLHLKNQSELIHIFGGMRFD
ncbi:response regulator receiver domain protein [Clostridiales bacterium 1_7_47FAA]|uniref:Stage 0 sporulation protein A homolog n=1 Tax=Enterocloster hominis (ex Hitch et al. 2024) TaxID=1917870 RepID=A0ABV1D3P6_9FIRM|nr:response regulator receiver domain protein [Clostridiales bacterium 1_7_47FAA]